MVLAISGPRRVPRDAAPRDNVGRSERWLSVLAGSALAVYGLDRRDPGGTVAALLGAALVYRGATAHCPVYGTLGLSSAGDTPTRRRRPASRAAIFRASDAVKIEHSVVVARSPAELYALWKDPVNLPRFLDWLAHVEPIDVRHARWTARGPGGMSVEWTAEIINDVPDALIAWKSVDEADIRNAGSVHFRRTADGAGTEVRLVFEWLPPGGKAGMIAARLLGAEPDRRIRDGLAKFRELAESGDAR